MGQTALTGEASLCELSGFEGLYVGIPSTKMDVLVIFQKTNDLHAS